MDKLEHYGIRGPPLELLSSYLTNRKQYVCLQDTRSSLIEIHQGVPQGSILGPLLFLIYINDIHTCLTAGDIYLYADDSTIFFSGTNIDLIASNTNHDLMCLNNWLLANKLSLNASKTTYCIFSVPQKQLASYPDIHINGTLITCTDKVKYLGVTLDKHLSWKDHIKPISSKINVLSYLFSKVRYIVPLRILYLLYYALAYPHLIYCIEVWGHLSK